jgi:hypothetical protein
MLGLVHIQPHICADYDPKKVIEGIRKSKGALKGVNRAALPKDIREQRGQNSKGRLAE